MLALRHRRAVCLAFRQTAFSHPLPASTFTSRRTGDPGALQQYCTSD